MFDVVDGGEDDGFGFLLFEVVFVMYLRVESVV